MRTRSTTRAEAITLTPSVSRSTTHQHRLEYTHHSQNDISPSCIMSDSSSLSELSTDGRSSGRSSPEGTHSTGDVQERSDAGRRRQNEERGRRNNARGGRHSDEEWGETEGEKMRNGWERKVDAHGDNPRTVMECASERETNDRNYNKNNTTRGEREIGRAEGGTLSPLTKTSLSSVCASVTSSLSCSSTSTVDTLPGGGSVCVSPSLIPFPAVETVSPLLSTGNVPVEGVEYESGRDTWNSASADSECVGEREVKDCTLYEGIDCVRDKYEECEVYRCEQQDSQRCDELHRHHISTTVINDTAPGSDSTPPTILLSPLTASSGSPPPPSSSPPSSRSCKASPSHTGGGEARRQQSEKVNQRESGERRERPKKRLRALKGEEVESRDREVRRGEEERATARYHTEPEERPPPLTRYKRAHMNGVIVDKATGGRVVMEGQRGKEERHNGGEEGEEDCIAARAYRRSCEMDMLARCKLPLVEMLYDLLRGDEASGVSIEPSVFDDHKIAVLTAVNYCTLRPYLIMRERIVSAIDEGERIVEVANVADLLTTVTEMREVGECERYGELLKMYRSIAIKESTCKKKKAKRSCPAQGSSTTTRSVTRRLRLS